MKFINQNSAVLSLSSALDPSYAVIDGRKEIDRLKFLTDFSSLINFYDQENKINGNWNPFLMKDPVFLTASIAKVNFNKLHNQFLKTCKSLNHLINNPVINDKHQDISISFNQIFNQLLSIFFRIERWSHSLLKIDTIEDAQHNFRNEFKQSESTSRDVGRLDNIAEVLNEYFRRNRPIRIQGRTTRVVNPKTGSSYTKSKDD